VDKCDETVTSQTTVSDNVAFDRIWTLAASIEHGTEQKTSLAFWDVAIVLKVSRRCALPLH